MSRGHLEMLWNHAHRHDSQLRFWSEWEHTVNGLVDPSALAEAIVKERRQRYMACNNHNKWLWFSSECVIERNSHLGSRNSGSPLLPPVLPDFRDPKGTEAHFSSSTPVDSSSLRIHIPRSAFALASASTTPSHGHSPVTRNGAPLPPEQDLAVRALLANALANNNGGGSLSVRRASLSSSASRAYTQTTASATSESRGSLVMTTPTTAYPYRYQYRRQPYDGIELDPYAYDEPAPVGVVHVDSGIRISRTLLMDLPPGYSAS
ncbi:hypothetical protein C8F01DRAFT_1320173 [Mycena amicta]|nr:hypothetical protein C8F01DRAFT_1320173 [Mycena amicta]